MKKKIFTLVFALVAYAGTMLAEVYEGACGQDLTWELNTETGVLSISGTGAMNDYSVHQPWYDYKDFITSVSLPCELTTIGSYAFSGCSNLASITIPNTVISIGYSAISGCSGLTDIIIPNSVKSIGSHAFYGCSGLNSVTIGSGVQRIAYAAFGHCDNINAVYISDIVAWCNIDFDEFLHDDYGYASNPVYHSKRLYLNGELLTDLVIPQGVTHIGNNAFYKDTCLKTVTIPASMREIGKLAFYDCTGLEGVYISDVAAWCEIDYKHYNGVVGAPLTYAHNLYLNNQLVTDLVIPEGVDSIKSFAFRGAQCLTSVTIPKSIKYISPSAVFGNCTNLVAAYFNATRCEDMMNGGVSIFCDADLSTLVFGNEVEYIPAFFCRNLEYRSNIVIPASVDSIGEYAFYNCEGLLSITCEDVTPPICKDNVFLNVDKSIPLYVPSESILIYQTADQWQDFMNIQPIPQPTSVFDIHTNPSNPAQKLIRDGNVYILTEEKTYTLTGQEVK